MARTDIFLSALTQAGRRITGQRRIICEYLASTRNHPTASQVYADISHVHPEISRATVYNTLNVLKEIGAIVEISFGDGHSHYETNTSPHMNLVCLRCHRIVDHPTALLVDGSDDELWDKAGFHPVAVKMDVFGFCDGCRERKKAEIREQWRLRHDGEGTSRSSSLEGK